MDAHHLDDDVARMARAYMAALLPPDVLADAWHDLLADTTYWREHRPVEVLRLAHQVVLQQERVAVPAALDLLAELGVRDRAAVSAILGVDEDEVVREVVEGDGEVGPSTHTAGGGFDPDVDVRGAPPAADAAVAPEPAPPGGGGPALRIGFDVEDDGTGSATDRGRADSAGEDDGNEEPRVSTMRWLVVAAIMIWTIILVLRALGVM